jgi:hypothetical protein
VCYATVLKLTPRQGEELSHRKQWTIPSGLSCNSSNRDINYTIIVIEKKETYEDMRKIMAAP